MEARTSARRGGRFHVVACVTATQESLQSALEGRGDPGDPPRPTDAPAGTVLECVGHFDEPQCAAVCPIGGCCVPDAAHAESKDTLFARAQRLHPHKDIQWDKAWYGVRG